VDGDRRGGRRDNCLHDTEPLPVDADAAADADADAEAMVVTVC
jgi:hypothetical protein